MLGFFEFLFKKTLDRQVYLKPDVSPPSKGSVACTRVMLVRKLHSRSALDLIVSIMTFLRFMLT